MQRARSHITFAFGTHSGENSPPDRKFFSKVADTFVQRASASQNKSVVIIEHVGIPKITAEEAEARNGSIDRLRKLKEAEDHSRLNEALQKGVVELSGHSMLNFWGVDSQIGQLIASKPEGRLLIVTEPLVIGVYQQWLSALDDKAAAAEDYTVRGIELRIIAMGKMIESAFKRRDTKLAEFVDNLADIEPINALILRGYAHKPMIRKYEGYEKETHAKRRDPTLDFLVDGVIDAYERDSLDKLELFAKLDIEYRKYLEQHPEIKKKMDNLARFAYSFDFAPSALVWIEELRSEIAQRVS